MSGPFEPIGGKARHFLRLARHREGVAFVNQQHEAPLARACVAAGYMQRDRWFPQSVLYVTENGRAYLDRLARSE